MMSRMWLCSGTSAPCEVLCREDSMGGVLMEWLLQQPQRLFLTASNTLPRPILYELHLNIVHSFSNIPGKM